MRVGGIANGNAAVYAYVRSLWLGVLRVKGFTRPKAVLALMAEHSIRCLQHASFAGERHESNFFGRSAYGYRFLLYN